ncbi:helix-turn-helix transcriptional regulator [Parvibacter caecicola]|uniref:helix-turn-helix transcriptional regulator n=1 Tax=Parvibacter caecicola TaxID=747645 RepID=UPI00249B1F3B|nr:helix-turn-helix transcriptional regulator [Parvibacter caecicola]
MRETIGGKDALLLGGFSFYQAWIFTFFFGPEIYPPSSSPVPAFVLIRLISLIALASVLLAAGLRPRVLTGFFKKQTAFGAAVALELCLALVPFARPEDVIGLAALLGIGVLSGFGTACLGLLWIRAFQAHHPKTLFMGLGFIIPLEAVTFFLPQTSAFALWACLVAFPALSFGFAWAAAKRAREVQWAETALAKGTSSTAPRSLLDAFYGSPTAAKDDGTAESPAGNSDRGFLIFFGICWALTGFAFGFMVMMSDFHGVPLLMFPWIALFACLLVVAFALAIFSRQEQHSISRPEALLITLILVSTLLAALLPQAGFSGVIPEWPGFVSLVCISLIEFFSLMLFAELARSLHISGEAIYCLGASFRSFGAFFGALAGGIVAIAFSSFVTTAVVIVLVCAAQLITAMGLLFLFIPIKKMRTQEQRRKSPISARCQALAKVYLLTPRETEILILLAKGHSVEGIQKELFIAKGTATTHMHHIYKKLGIHSRQELLEMLDGSAHEDF